MSTETRFYLKYGFNRIHLFFRALYLSHTQLRFFSQGEYRDHFGELLILYSVIKQERIYEIVERSGHFVDNFLEDYIFSGVLENIL